MKTLLVGDTHANGWWLQELVFPQAIKLEVDQIIQVGDFGWWPKGTNGKTFIKVAKESPVPLYFLDGNHEDHSDLAEWTRSFDKDSPIHFGGSLYYLPRSCRLNIDGVSLVACGGAWSIDRSDRVPDVSWFLEEKTNDIDVARCAAGGHADILLTHDAPSGYTVPGTHDSHIPTQWLKELPECHANRDTIRRVMEAVTPRAVVHGHYHQGYERMLNEWWGGVIAIGLDKDDSAHNLVLLTTKDQDFYFDRIGYEVPDIPDWRWRYKSKRTTKGGSNK